MVCDIYISVTISIGWGPVHWSCPRERVPCVTYLDSEDVLQWAPPRGGRRIPHQCKGGWSQPHPHDPFSISELHIICTVFCKLTDKLCEHWNLDRITYINFSGVVVLFSDWSVKFKCLPPIKGTYMYKHSIIFGRDQYKIINCLFFRRGKSDMLLYFSTILCVQCTLGWEIPVLPTLYTHVNINKSLFGTVSCAPAWLVVCTCTMYVHGE